MNSQNGRLEDVEDGAMLRTFDGTINEWNRNAEELYGWRREDAVGRVSHELLRTQFPQPLEQIELELLNKGLWEGKLVHETRDKGRIVVKSRWTLDSNSEGNAVIEVNAPAASVPPQPEGSSRGRHETAVSTGEAAETAWRRTSRAFLLQLLFILLIAGLTAIWLTYALAGHRLIEWLYTSDSQWADRWLAGRHLTPLHTYYQAADRFLLIGTLQVLALYGFLIVVLRKPVALVLAGVSVILMSLALFGFFEIFPNLIRPLGLHVSSYHAYKANHLYDAELAWRERPHNRVRIVNFKGSHYSPLYGVGVPPTVIEWQIDANGFRNSPPASGAADIIAISDSTFEYGDNTADTFVSRLAQHLPGVAVTNLSKAGYNPFHYVTLLKRFGVKLQPRYALFGFYEGNDIDGIRNHMAWRSGEADNPEPFYRYSQLSFFRRYRAAVADGLTAVKRAIGHQFDVVLERLARQRGYHDSVHRDLAMLNLGGFRLEPVLFVDRLDTASPEQMLGREEWQAFEQILREFKQVSTDHGIIPIIAYLPASVHIYAEFSSDESGHNWLFERDAQIAAKKNTFNAVRHLSQKLGIAMIDVSPAFEAAAQEGILLSYRLDSHWNSEGRELAARVVAEALKSDFNVTPRQIARKPAQGY